ncbi:hypothetical protein HN587_04610 [Candidatus Woesearchaeota archaeon]|jgi:hypothetical protein|nr:hypothetical protein [Candidatus Woesearchaeota archaeon]
MTSNKMLKYGSLVLLVLTILLISSAVFVFALSSKEVSSKIKSLETFRNTALFNSIEDASRDQLIEIKSSPAYLAAKDTALVKNAFINKARALSNSKNLKCNSDSDCLSTETCEDNNCESSNSESSSSWSGWNIIKWIFIGVAICLVLLVVLAIAGKVRNRYSKKASENEDDENAAADSAPHKENDGSSKKTGVDENESDPDPIKAEEEVEFKRVRDFIKYLEDQNLVLKTKLKKLKEQLSLEETDFFSKDAGCKVTFEWLNQHVKDKRTDREDLSVVGKVIEKIKEFDLSRNISTKLKHLPTKCGDEKDYFNAIKDVINTLVSRIPAMSQIFEKIDLLEKKQVENAFGTLDKSYKLIAINADQLKLLLDFKKRKYDQFTDELSFEVIHSERINNQERLKKVYSEVRDLFEGLKKVEGWVNLKSGIANLVSTSLDVEQRFRIKYGYFQLIVSLSNELDSKILDLRSLEGEKAIAFEGLSVTLKNSAIEAKEIGETKFAEKTYADAFKYFSTAKKQFEDSKSFAEVANKIIHPDVRRNELKKVIVRLDNLIQLCTGEIEFCTNKINACEAEFKKSTDPSQLLPSTSETPDDSSNVSSNPVSSDSIVPTPKIGGESKVTNE